MKEVAESVSISPPLSPGAKRANGWLTTALLWSVVLFASDVVANSVPVITSTAVTAATQDSEYSYTLAATDGDGDELIWSVKDGETLPSWLSLVVGSEYSVSTLAGTAGIPGSADGIGTEASFNSPVGVAADGSGNLYVVDSLNYLIRKVDSDGKVTTLAGSGTEGSADGTGAAASFAFSAGIAVDGNGNIYVADRNNHLIRKITSEGEVTTFAGTGSAGSADGIGTEASFSAPSGVAFDGSGNLYVAEQFSSRIRKITPDAEVSSFAGRPFVRGSADGTGAEASFDRSYGVAVDSSGNVYVTERFINHLIRKITPEGVVTTVAGTAGIPGSADGVGIEASFDNPAGVVVDGSGNLYVADRGNHLIRKITPEGVVTTVAGSGSEGSADGTGTEASFNAPLGITLDGGGNLYVAEYNNHLIRKISLPAVRLNGTPSNADVGDHDVCLVVSDGTESAEQCFTITVANVNDMPEAVADAVETSWQRAIEVDVVSNDLDADGDSLFLVSASVGLGSVELVDDVTLRYTPPANFSGDVTVSYAIEDGNDGTATGSLVVTVLANRVPVTTDDVAVTNYKTPITVNVLENDNDPDEDVLTLTSVQSSEASAVISNGAVLFTPEASTTGVVAVSYTVEDPYGATATSQLVITVEGNQAPVVVDDAAQTDDRTPIVIDVLANDSDALDDELTVTSAVAEAGTVSVVGNRLEYAPASGFDGIDRVTYEVSDGFGGTGIGVVTVDVSAYETITVINRSGGSMGAGLLLLGLLLVWRGALLQRVQNLGGRRHG